MTYSLTTPLYYVNDKPHLGSTYTTLACDALARFQRLEGNDVVFITGVDEHGQKIQRTAADRGVTPQEHCDAITKRYLSLWSDWGISNDRFVRTTAERHLPLVEAFFKRCEANGDIRIGRQTGWYCVGCEEFKDEPAEAKDPCCPIHQKALEWRDEENLFFCLSHFQERIEALINQPGFIAPASRRKEIQNFVAGGLRDFSISRVNVAWGLPVPGHEGHTFYVWFDALLGYLTALLDDGYPAIAYSVAATHAASSPEDIVEAEFHAGWLALRYLKNASSEVRIVELDGGEQNIVVRVDPIDHPNAGEKVHLHADSSAVHLFDVESGERLN